MRTSRRMGAMGTAGMAVALFAVTIVPVPVSAQSAAAAGTSATARTATMPAAARRATAPRPQFWFPFRGPVKVGCVVNNCGKAMNGGHHYWAFDFSGPEGTPVHAAASGIVHIGGRAGCVSRSASTSARRGNWVWIDHGQGRRTQYRHLRTITIKDGQRVTPATRIGTMGHTGIAPCSITYTHFEYMVGAKARSPWGVKVNPGPMLGCVVGVRTTYPQAVNKGNPNWNDLNASPRSRVTIATDTSIC